MNVKQYVRDRVFSMLPNPHCTAGYPRMAEGNPCVIENPSVTPIRDCKVYGSSAQESRTSRNLIPYPYQETTRTENGITFTDNGDGTIFADGISDASYTIFTLGTFEVEAGTYFLSGCCEGGNYELFNFGYCLLANGETDSWSETGNGTLMQVDETQNIEFLIFLSTDTTNSIFSSLLFQPQLELGTEATAFMKYGATSPSPAYPAEIVSVGENKNRIDFYNKENWTLQDGKYCLSVTGLKLGEAYTLSFKPDTYSAYVYFQYKPNTADAWTTVYLTADQIVRSKYTFTVEENTQYRIWTPITNVNELDSLFSKMQEVQIEPGSSVTFYVPYGKYGVAVDVHGKNLFDVNAIRAKTISVVDNEIVMPVATSGNGGVALGETLKELCPALRAGDRAVLNFKRNYGEQNKFIWLASSQYLWRTGTARTITQSDLDGRVTLYGNRYDNGEEEQIILSEFQIEAGDQATAYAPYVSNVAALALDEPLRGIKDSDGSWLARDEIVVDGKNGTVKHIQNVADYTISGNTAGVWRDRTDEGGYLSICKWFQLQSYAFQRVLKNGVGLCDRFGEINSSILPDATHLRLANVSDGSVSFGFIVPGEEFASLEAFRSWLTQNPAHILYGSMTPTETDITNTETGQALLSLQHTPHITNLISADTAVQGEIAVKYHTFDHKEAQEDV